MFSKLELITIIIAITALLLPSIRNWYNEWKRLKDTKKYVLFIVNETLTPLRKKIDGLETLIKGIKDIDSTDFPLFQYITYYLENFDKISHNDLYKIFVQKKWWWSKKEKMSNFKKLNTSIGFLLKYNSIEDRNMTKFTSDRRRYEKNYHSNVDKILRLHDVYISKNIQNDVTKSDDPFLITFNKIVKDWQKKENFNKFSASKKLFIDPLNSLCIKYPSNDRSMEILPLTIYCDYALIDIMNLHSVHYSSLSNALGTIKRRVEDIELFIKYYS